MFLPRYTYLTILIGLFAVVSVAISSELPTNQIEIENATHAKPGEITIKVVRLLPADGVITAHEPILAEIEAKNVSSRIVKIVTSPYLALKIEVEDSKGRLVGSSPDISNIVDRAFGIKDLTPGQSIKCFIIISALCQFNHPDTYKISIESMDGWQSVPSKLAEDTVTVKVLPFDAVKLKQRCDEIFGPLSDFGKTQSLPQNLGDFPLEARLKALYSIRQNTVLPYLRRIELEWQDSSESWPAMIAIRRIGSRESDDLYQELLSRQDSIGETARKAPAQSDITEYDYSTYWQ